jgi:hypothetical protein
MLRVVGVTSRQLEHNFDAGVGGYVDPHCERVSEPSAVIPEAHGLKWNSLLFSQQQAQQTQRDVGRHLDRNRFAAHFQQHSHHSQDNLQAQKHSQRQKEKKKQRDCDCASGDQHTTALILTTGVEIGAPAGFH